MSRDDSGTPIEKGATVEHGGRRLRPYPRQSDKIDRTLSVKGGRAPAASDEFDVAGER